MIANAYGILLLIASFLKIMQRFASMPSSYEHMTDQELLQRFYIDRNNEWLGILLQRYTLLLFGVGMKYLKNEEEARDAVQQVFLKVLTEVPKYKVEYFKSWLYMIAKNHCLMKLREKGIVKVEVNERLHALKDEDEGPERQYEKERMLNHMGDAVEELAEEQKRCITLFYLQKRSYQEIVEETGYNMMQVKSYIQNGKRNLKNILQRRLAHG
jgi:RNA polymerase sigma factor (sigma-70 family)